MGSIKKVLRDVLPHAVVRRYEKRYELRPADAPLNNNKVAVFSSFKTMYTELLHEAVREAGFESTPRIADAKYIWLHWYENRLSDYDQFVDRLETIKTWKRQGRKIIFHIHNKKPHDSIEPSVAHALMTALADVSDQVSIMSTQTKDVLKDIWYDGENFSRVSQVPHPNYIGAYGKRIENISLKNDTLKILFFGLVRPYKGIEHLLEATRGLKKVEITIAGKASDPIYGETIKELCAKRGDVTLRLEHIKDEEIPEIFAKHHVVALPYNIESSLNSGAAILAMSYARTIVGTNNGTLSDISNSSLYFGYNYLDEADHTRQLRKSIKAIQSKYGKDYGKLLDLGEELFKLVKKENSTKAVAKSVKEMIARIH